MIQEAASAAAAPVGNANAQALQQVGASHFLHEILTHPLAHAIDFIVLIVLVVMSISSWYYIIAIAIRVK